MNQTTQPLWKLLGVLFKAHPWTGVYPGEHVPDLVQCFIEVVPSDTHKYEIEKVSGYLKVDRPQKYSNICPALYGFIPQTFCGESVAAYSAAKTGRTLEGDADPLDICVLTDRPVQHGNVLVECVPIGGFRILDQNEAGDKIIGVLKEEATYGSWTDILEEPGPMPNRLNHFFLSFKQSPRAQKS